MEMMEMKVVFPESIICPFCKNNIEELKIIVGTKGIVGAYCSFCKEIINLREILEIETSEKTILWKELKCPLCQKKEIEPFFNGVDFKGELIVYGYCPRCRILILPSQLIN